MMTVTAHQHRQVTSLSQSESVDAEGCRIDPTLIECSVTDAVLPRWRRCSRASIQLLGGGYIPYIRPRILREVQLWWSEVLTVIMRPTKRPSSPIQSLYSFRYLSVATSYTTRHHVRSSCQAAEIPPTGSAANRRRKAAPLTQERTCSMPLEGSTDRLQQHCPTSAPAAASR